MVYTVKIYRFDRRCKSGERFVNSYDFDRKDNAAMDREVNALRGCGYFDDMFRIEYAPKFITVKNIMSGKDVQIAADTPWSCRPDSESYWSA
jgi:hypothetical protein